MSLKQRIVTVPPSDLHWPFGNRSEPCLRVGGTRWPRSVAVDPFPSYAHDPGLVMQTAAQVEARFPVGAPPTYYVLPFEDLARTNGAQACEVDHRVTPPAGERLPIVQWITLSAKRIPIHPAVTRYLVAHEYGHAVEDWITWSRGLQNHDDTVRREYAEMRGIDPDVSAEGGTWHAAAGEVMACDFRLIVCGVEGGYWPHPGITRPEDVPAAREWWMEQREKWGISPSSVLSA